MSKKSKKKLNNGRDYNMVAIINGVTKSYVEKDQKKEANKKLARKKVSQDEE